MADHAALGTNEVFRRRALNPRRLKGLGAFAASLSIYSYAPYLAVYLGATAPVLGAVAAGLYGMLAFGETQIINKITLIKDGGANHGKVTINVGQSAFSTYDIVADVRDIQSILSLGNDNLGRDNTEGNILRIDRYLKSNQLVEEGIALTLPADAFRDRQFLDWLIADKTGQGSLVDDFQDLMVRRHE
jgi:hypothetical protein